MNPGDLVMAEYFKMAVNGGAFVILAWLIRHTFQHTVPRIVSQFSQSLKEQQGTFQEEMRLERAAHKDETDRFWKHLEDSKGK